MARPASGHLELIRDISSPFALNVMTHFLGLPAAMGPELKRFSDSFFRLFAPSPDAATLERVNADLAAFRMLLRDAIRSGRISEGGLLAAAPSADDQPLIDNAILLFADGVETIERGMATILRVLAEDDLLHATPTEAMITEALRLRTPAQINARAAREPFSLAGWNVSQGTPLFLALGAANRDPAVFDAPDTFQLERREAPALTFGRGRHSCIGSVLAIGQFLALSEALVARGVAVPRQEMRYLPRAGHLWPVRLLITLN